MQAICWSLPRLIALGEIELFECLIFSALNELNPETQFLPPYANERKALPAFVTVYSNCQTRDREKIKTLCPMKN